MSLDSQDLLDLNIELVSKKEAIQDYRACYRSRQISYLGRREVLTGKAKFGIFGDGKELPQIVMARYFRNGDIRSGYYRDQTLAFELGISTYQQFFAQLYAHADLEAEPFSGGRQMNTHFATRFLDEKGEWLSMTDKKVTHSDMSCTASQMPRIAGLVQASKLYRNNPRLAHLKDFSNNGNEVVFGTIGNASCAEGHFWETLNAVGVIQGPLVMSIWDDGYGISVPNDFQFMKSSLSEMLQGFQRTTTEKGFEVLSVNGWDYESLIKTYSYAVKLARDEHIPSIIHVQELTQPQGHSTSGSHERYKSEERLNWEKDYDCLSKLRSYLLDKKFATEEEIQAWEAEDLKLVRKVKQEAWSSFQNPLKEERREFLALMENLGAVLPEKAKLKQLIDEVRKIQTLSRRDFMQVSYRALMLSQGLDHPAISALKKWRRELSEKGNQLYSSHQYSQSAHSPLLLEEVKPQYSEDPEMLNGFEIINRNFDLIFERNKQALAFGEDVGHLGDVNQGFADLQAKHGTERIMDTGIRELSIMGQAIGLSVRGFRPIAEIQYLDYLIYGLQPLTDDLATLHYRTAGGQKAPAIIRTRGHRLEGIWHSGSPMAMMLSTLRGIHIAVPRNMTKAAAFYNTFLKGDDPAIIVEVLNGYRLKEALPENLGEITIRPGIPEVIREGSDITLVTYGACCKLAMEAAELLEEMDIDVEIIDVQCLLPFDREHQILESIKKTNRVLFLDEDVPGGATAYMMQEVVEKQAAFQYLDSEPKTLSSQAHRPAYGDDGDYWSKPQLEHICQAAYEIMHEADPASYPLFT
ncbi:MAG: thiamine pyrophosphate-dependent enzyme [Bacteroidia bacterium]|nr:thiamine pyrophosphate-dependent enzyme [Bacteroidia bacterium]